MERPYLLMVIAIFCLVLCQFGSSGAGDIQYTYDHLNRLIRVDYENGNRLEYGYDDAGNRIARSASYVGSLAVTLSPQEAIDAGAQWQADGDGTWRDSGTSGSGISVGQHTINFKDIPEWDAPASQAVSVSKGQTTPVTAGYTPQFAAEFTGTPMSGKAPLIVVFSDRSYGTVTSWLWEFGDGRKSTRQNPVHRYEKAGSYPVKLTVTGPKGVRSKTQTAYINAYTLPRANFAVTPKSGMAPLRVSFLDKSKGSVTGWLWNFGDTQTSQDRNPVHTFAAPGTYRVNLTATGPVGSSTKAVKVEVKAP